MFFYKKYVKICKKFSKFAKVITQICRLYKYKNQLGTAMEDDITINLSKRLFSLGYNYAEISGNINQSAQNLSNANPGISLNEAKNILTNILNDIEEKIVIIDNDNIEDNISPNQTNQAQNISETVDNTNQSTFSNTQTTLINDIADSFVSLLKNDNFLKTNVMQEEITEIIIRAFNEYYDKDVSNSEFIQIIKFQLISSGYDVNAINSNFQFMSEKANQIIGMINALRTMFIPQIDNELINQTAQVEETQANSNDNPTTKSTEELISEFINELSNILKKRNHLDTKNIEFMASIINSTIEDYDGTQKISDILYTIERRLAIGGFNVTDIVNEKKFSTKIWIALVNSMKSVLESIELNTPENPSSSTNPNTTTPTDQTNPASSTNTTTPATPENSNIQTTTLKQGETINFSAGGVTIKITSLDNNAKYGYSYSDAQKILTIYAENCKIQVNEVENQNTIIKLQGTNIDFYSNKQVKAINSYANNSNINGSDETDVINNMGNNTTINAGNGNDIISNYGENAEIYGGADDDYIKNYNKGTDSILDGGHGKDIIINDASGVTINANSDAKITNNNSSSTINQLETLNNNENAALLTDLFMSLFDAGDEHENEYIPDNIIKSIQLLYSTLFEEDGSTLTELGQYVIARGSLETRTDIDYENNELLLKQLEAGINYIAKNSADGTVTADDLIAFTNETESVLAIDGCLSLYFDEKLGIPLSDEEYSYLIHHKQPEILLNNMLDFYTELKDLMQQNEILSLSSSQKEKIKQLLPVIDMLNYYNAAEIALNDNYTIDSNLLKDIEMVLEAQNSDNPDEYIKSQMIKKADNISSLFTSTNAGEVGEVNGILYVNDGTQMVKLNIDGDTYLNLFPPMQRYIIQQDIKLGDCFFLATGAIPMIENGEGFAQLLKMFKQNSNGDITLTIPGYSAYPITFQNGQPKDIDGKFYLSGMKIQTKTTGVNSCLGIIMLEQAYALARFAQTHNTSINNLDIDKAFDYIFNGHGNLPDELEEGGYDYEAFDLILGNTPNTTSRTSFTNSQTDNYALLDLWSDELKAGDTVISTAIFNNISEETSSKYYSLIAGHSYVIDSIDKTSQIVYVKNPYFAYGVMKFTYEEFINLFFGATCAKL